MAKNDEDNLEVSGKLTKEQRDRLEYRRLEREEMESSYDLAKLFSGEIKKQEAELEKVIKNHEDISARLKNQLMDISKQAQVISGIRAASVKYSEEIREQSSIVASQMDVVKQLETDYNKAKDARKAAGEALRRSYDEVNRIEQDLIKLQDEKQIKENAFAKLKARNLKYDEIRTKLGWDMVRAIQTGNQEEVDAINRKLKLTNNLIKFTSDEMDSNRTSVEMLDKQSDATRKLLKDKRSEAALAQENANKHGAILRKVIEQKNAAKQVLIDAEATLSRKQKIYNVTMDSLKEEQAKLLLMQDQANLTEKELKDSAKKIRQLESLISLMKKMQIVVGEVDKFLESTGEHYGKTKALIMDIAKGGATAWLAVIKASLERWIELDKAAGEFRQKTGFLVNQTKELDKAAREVNVQMAHLGVNIGEAYAAAGALTEEFQVIGLVTKEAIANTAMVAANLGIGVAESAKFKGMFESIAESSGTTADGAIKSAAALAKMGGVAPSAVMKDMASASGETLSFLAKSPMALMRASVEARRLGTTVGALSKSARGFLNYQDSITSELEASALIGKALNFQEARAAAYAGDVVKSRELALKQIEKAGEFTKLNVYQQEALAKAAGMTVDEVIKQQNQQKLLAKLESSRPELYAKYKEMQDKIRENERAAADDLEKQAEEMAKQRLMQAEMNKLSNAFASIWTDISDSLLAIANAIMPPIITTARVLGGIFKVIGSLIRGILSPFDKIGNAMRNSNEGGLNLEKIMTKVAGWFEKTANVAEFLGTVISNIAMGFSFIVSPIALILRLVGRIASFSEVAFAPFNAVASVFRSISAMILRFSRGLTGLSRIFSPILKGVAGMFKFFGAFAKFLGPIGLIVNAVQFVFALFDRFSKIQWGDSIGENILIGLQAVGGALYDVLIQPFVDVWNWLKEKFISNSPSELGLRIVEGIKSVGSMLVDALTWPFRTVFNFVSGLFGGDGELGNKIIEGIKSIGEFMFDALTWPFKKLMSFASKIPFIGKFFGGGNADASANVTVEAQVKSSAQPASTVEVTGLTELKETVDKLVDAITKLGGVAGTAAPVVNVNNNSTAMAEKLDELIGLLKEGAIAVNMDGILVSKTLAKTS